jgi:hypothetical protein
MTKLNAIRTALGNHLATMSPAPPSIAWPNQPFTPAVDANGRGVPYIRAQFIPVTRRPVVVGPSPEQRHTGLFMLTIYTPEDAGDSAGLILADSLVARFNGSSSIVAATVTVRLDYSEAKLPLHAPPFYVIPVEIGWHSFVTP